MNRHSLVGRLGHDDVVAVPIAQRDSVVLDTHFVREDGSFNFGIGPALERLAGLGLAPTERALDLVILAALVTAADTRVSRKANSQDGWTREIDLYVPVSDPSLWRELADELATLLRFLTGDRWRFVFRRRPESMGILVADATLLEAVPVDTVCLFSGGLDSLVGAIDLLGSGARPLLVSHYWDSETANAQNTLLDSLGKRFPPPDNEFHSLRVRLGFDRHALESSEKELTQRGRSFLFFALAALAASSIDRAVTIHVPENGLIALNVPLDRSRLGALSTRTTHPHFMAGMNDLLKRIGVSGELINRYRHSTKGEMVAGCVDPKLLGIATASSMSCSSAAKARYQEMSPRHCGYCVPCLIRRASLLHGLEGADQTLYTIKNLAHEQLASDKAEGEHVRALQRMSARLAGRPDLADILVHKSGPLRESPAEVSAFADVLRRGIAEVGELLRNVRAGPRQRS